MFLASVTEAEEICRGMRVLGQTTISLVHNAIIEYVGGWFLG